MITTSSFSTFDGTTCALLLMSLMAPSVQAHCVDSNSFKFSTEHVGKRDCDWLADKWDRRYKYCNTKGWNGEASKKVKYYCEYACDLNDCRDDHDRHYDDDYDNDDDNMDDDPEDKRCYDHDSFTFQTQNSGEQDCKWLRNRPSRQERYCETKEGRWLIKYRCRRSCANYLDGDQFDRCDKHRDDDDYGYDDDVDDDEVDDDEVDDNDDGKSGGSCKDNKDFKFETEYVGKRDCEWLGEKSNRKKKYCETKGWNGKSSKRIKHYCQDSCDKYLSKCYDNDDPFDDDDDDDSDYEDKKCYDDEEFTFKTENTGYRDCDWLSEKTFRQHKYCEGKGWDGDADKKVKFACRRSCANFLDGDKFDKCDKYTDDDFYEDDDSYSAGDKCKDHKDFRFATKDDGKRDCDWLSRKRSRQRQYCNTKGWNGKANRRIKTYCQDSCSKYIGKCRNHNDFDDDDTNGNCDDSKSFKFETEFVGKKDCDWLSEKTDRQEKYCESKGYENKSERKVKYECKESCKRYNKNC